MARYTVIASSQARGVVVVQDESGRCHLGRAVKTAPTAGVVLQGQTPALGLRALRIVGVNRPCPVDLLLLNCHPIAAVRAVHACELRGARSELSPSFDDTRPSAHVVAAMTGAADEGRQPAPASPYRRVMRWLQGARQGMQLT